MGFEKIASNDKGSRIHGWIKSYASEKIDSAVFSALIVLDNFFTALPDDIPDQLHLKSAITVCIRCLETNKRLSPKEEQEVKGKPREIEKAFNNGGLSEEDSAECEDKIAGVIGFLTHETTA
jgi:hypothetical protein